MNLNPNKWIFNISTAKENQMCQFWMHCTVAHTVEISFQSFIKQYSNPRGRSKVNSVKFEGAFCLRMSPATVRTNRTNPLGIVFISRRSVKSALVALIYLKPFKAVKPICQWYVISRVVPNILQTLLLNTDMLRRIRTGPKICFY